MAEKTRWSYIKKELKDKPVKELEAMLKEFQMQAIKLDVQLRKGKGIRSSYPLKKGEWGGRGNVRQLRKQIACLKTHLRVKDGN